MQLRNSSERYGLITVALHWVVAFVVPSMFALGLWMTSLTYYHAWYNQGPLIHKGVGFLLFIILLLRLLWRLMSLQPAALHRKHSFERLAAQISHILLYLLLFLLIISGYLISTVEGASLEVFNLFEVPALIQGFEEQEDIAGELHFLFAYTLLGLAALHATAALKHHFIDKDRTLLRMLGR